MTAAAGGRSERPADRGTDSPFSLTVRGVRVDAVRRPVKRLSLRVHPPDGSVRASVPPGLREDVLRAVVARRMPWIQRTLLTLGGQERDGPRDLVSGESVRVGGRVVRLRVVEKAAGEAAGVREDGHAWLELRVEPGADLARRASVLAAWRRGRLKQRAATLLARWEPEIGVRVSHLGVREMRTRWATCNMARGRVLLNLELDKRPVAAVEYVLVVHLLRIAGIRDVATRSRELDLRLPGWRQTAGDLGCGTLGV